MACCAVRCKSRTTTQGVKTPDLSFHRFPTWLEKRNEWIKAVRRENWEPTKNSRLCSKHFDESCFMTGKRNRKLKPDAVPTIFESYAAYYQPAQKKRKAPTIRTQIVGISPKKRWKMEEGGVNPETIPTLLTKLAKSRIVAANRLRTIKRLTASKRRLLKKNAALSQVIKELRNKNLLDTESFDSIVVEYFI